MSLKIIADACRIVDRGQDLALRSSNRPYNPEEDELVKNVPNAQKMLEA